MKLYGGIDLHSNNSVIHIIDEQGVSQLKKKVTNDLKRTILNSMPVSRISQLKFNKYFYQILHYDPVTKNRKNPKLNSIFVWNVHIYFNTMIRETCGTEPS